MVMMMMMMNDFVDDNYIDDDMEYSVVVDDECFVTNCTHNLKLQEFFFIIRKRTKLEKYLKDFFFFFPIVFCQNKTK